MLQNYFQIARKVCIVWIYITVHRSLCDSEVNQILTAIKQDLAERLKVDVR